MTTRGPTDADRAIGQRVRLARKIARLSQTQLAEKVGVTYQQIQKYENGTDRIGAGRLHQVAIVTDHPIAFFFNFGSEDPTTPAETETALSDPAIQKLLAAASSIRSPAALAKLAAVAATFAASEGDDAPREAATAGSSSFVAATTSGTGRRRSRYSRGR